MDRPSSTTSSPRALHSAPRSITFSVLLVLAAFIASFGLYQDSVASIIGAMVVAPLGGAIMAFAGALVTARGRWQWVTGLQVILGALAVVAIGFLVSWVLPDILELTPSLDARTAPGLLDLGVALTAGAAGAYVAVRRTGTDALPGVAIAVALVPPLATVGICLELGRVDDAGGALLLFVTNFAAIVVAACIVFVLAGAAPSREMIRERHRVRNGFVTAVIALVIIAMPLFASGVQQAAEWTRATTGAPVVRGWIGERDLTVESLVGRRRHGVARPGRPRCPGRHRAAGLRARGRVRGARHGRGRVRRLRARAGRRGSVTGWRAVVVVGRQPPCARIKIRLARRSAGLR